MKAHIKTASEIKHLLLTRFDLTADVQIIPVKGENRTLYPSGRVS
jgi:hypothetical protein